MQCGHRGVSASWRAAVYFSKRVQPRELLSKQGSLPRADCGSMFAHALTRVTGVKVRAVQFNWFV
jgi:hypothetical protein